MLPRKPTKKQQATKRKKEVLKRDHSKTNGMRCTPRFAVHIVEDVAAVIYMSGMRHTRSMHVPFQRTLSWILVALNVLLFFWNEKLAQEGTVYLSYIPRVPTSASRTPFILWQTTFPVSSTSLFLGQIPFTIFAITVTT